MYVVLGASGNTGSVVVEKLLNAGKKVRAVARHPEKLARFTNRGAEAVSAQITDEEALRKAFAGATAVYVMIPPDPTSNDFRAFQDATSEAVARGLEAASVKHAVVLSSFGADKPDKTGPIVGVYRMEQRLNQIAGLNVLHLRAGYFMENALPQVNVIQMFGMMAGPLEPDLLVPMIATKDIGAVAADALLKLDFSGKQTRELQGQRHLSYNEAAKIIGTAIGRPGLAYVRLPDDQIVHALTSMGMSKNFASLIVDMADAENRGLVATLEPRSTSNTTPTSFEEFVRDVFVPAFKGQAASA
jgi:uncharacterized protein YbjT (DUF2867 family)